MTTKYKTIIIGDNIQLILRDAGQKTPPETNGIFEMPISIEELQAAVKQGKTKGARIQLNKP
jgi:hypothetical protein